LDELANNFIIGLDPSNIEKLRDRLYRSNHALHVPGPLQAQAIAAVEMACWDIIGKKVNEPIYSLLGGEINNEVRSYTYMHYEWTPPAPPEEAAEVAKKYSEQGFTAVKLDPIPPYKGPREITLEELDYAESVVGAIRKAVGSKCDIIIGTHGQLNTSSAVKFAEKIEEYDPLWFEEPVPPERVDEMAKVADSTSVPVATGERITTTHQAAELLETNAAQIVQPNVGMTGILEAKKIAGMCEAHYAQVAPWMYCGPVAGAASVHLDVCSPTFLIQEGIEQWDGFHAELLEEPIIWKDGHIQPPTGPGLGIELDEDVLADHSYNKISPGEFSWF
jgi:L-alanine-DL-glutamate epimerase-like enolase superfamily enzyme